MFHVSAFGIDFEHAARQRNENYNHENHTLHPTVYNLLGIGAFFDPFMFDLIITDLTDGASGRFAGLSDGGTIYSEVSPLTLEWVPT